MNLKHYASVILIYFSTISAAYADTLEPFTTDGCSSFPDGTIEDRQLFYACCEIHDFAYWQGGTEQQRLTADQEFSACISDLGQPLLAKAMYAGVRIGGLPYWPTPYRWGYGWPYPRQYGQLSAAELAQVKALTPANFINKEI